MAITPYLRLQKPPFDTIPWDEAVNGNMDIIDGFAAQFLSIPNFGGTWNNSTAYSAGQIILDPVTALLWQCAVSHTSAAPPTTFSQDRTANPSYWLSEGIAPPTQTTTNTGRNLFHNGLFELAQRGGSPWTTRGYTFDRWIIDFGTGDTVSSTPTMVSPGQLGIGDESPRVVSSVSYTGANGATNFVYLLQKIENVRQLSGKTVTISFYANTSAPGTKVGVNLLQHFGSGGSGDVETSGIAVALTAYFARYSVVLAVPSAVGKTVGTNFDDYTQVAFWLSAGSAHATSSGGVGVQTSFVNFWGMQVELGNLLSPLDKPDLSLWRTQCQRFYQVGVMQLYGYQVGGNLVSVSNPLPVSMRAIPFMTTTIINAVNVTGLSIGALSFQSINMSGTITATGGYIMDAKFTASADL